MDSNIIIRVRRTALDNQQESADFRIQRICGYINVKDFCKLMYTADNKVNPRSAKINPVVKQIQETLRNNPELFWIKSRGILISTHQCARLDRNRLRLSFDQSDSDGIMDGGHNTLAIAAYIIQRLFSVSVTTWQECKSFWQQNISSIEKAIGSAGNAKQFDFLIPVEIIAPLNETQPGISAQEVYTSELYFSEVLPDICSARNTNAQLAETAKSNQIGLYDELKVITKDLDIIWKSGEGSGIKCDDVIALACLPLLFLQEQGVLRPEAPVKLSPISLYSQKSKCVSYYRRIISDPSVSERRSGKHIIRNKAVLSALKLVKDLIQYFDQLYLIFPDMYNAVPGCKFGPINSVKMMPCEVHFRSTPRKSDKTYPDGFIYPLLCSTTKLMQYDEKTQTVSWKKAPHLLGGDELVSAHHQDTYVNFIKVLNFDPQRVGKEKAMYDVAADMYLKILAQED